jgi:protein involved in polysaccharide export with SLBB domain
MKIRDLIAVYEDLLPESYFDYAVVMRRTIPSLLERSVSFDLGKALSDPASKDNITLEPFDRIIIYHRDFFDPHRVVHIDGAVTNPGAYKLIENMTVRDLILQAGGLMDDASTQKGELYRRRFEGETGYMEKIEFNVTDAMLDNSGHNVQLRRVDRVFIRSRKNWEPERKVTLSGQVVYPGTYMIFEDETLGDIIKRAGGFRDDAYLPAALFIRQSVKQMEEQRMKQYSQGLEMDMTRLAIEMASKGVPSGSLMEQQTKLTDIYARSVVLGRVMIDMTDEDQYKTFGLEDGDELFVPRDLNTVSVIGDVYNQATFRYEARKSAVTHYIDNAGGTLHTADAKRIYVIKANGTVVSNQAKPIKNENLMPGDVVVVPTKIRYPNRWKIFVDSADAAFKVASLLTTIITLVIVINTASNNSSGN